MYFFKFWSKQGEYERENSLGWSKKCHDKKSPLKFAIFELQKWYIPKNKCQLTLQNWGVPPPKKILHTPLNFTTDTPTPSLCQLLKWPTSKEPRKRQESPVHGSNLPRRSLA